MINGYYLTTLGQREATLRQLNTALPASMRIRQLLNDTRLSTACHDLIRARASRSHSSLAAFGARARRAGRRAARDVRPRRAIRRRRAIDRRPTEGDDRLDRWSIMRALDGESPTSEQAFELRRELEAMARALTENGGVGRGVGRRASCSRGDAGRDSRHRARCDCTGWIGIISGWRRRAVRSRTTSYSCATPVSADRFGGADSPAQRAGIAPGDTLIAYDGNDVVRRAINMTRAAGAECELAVTRAP